MKLADWIQTFLLVATIIGLIITNINNKRQLEIFNQHLKLNFFSDYTKRYQEIILNFPENINKPSFVLEELAPEEKIKTIKYMRAYFDLCSEEFDLWQAGYIEERIWENWKSGIQYNFSKKSYRDAWEEITQKTYYNEEFVKFVNQLKAD